jgi:pyruvate dehydrogenase E2 component (dihydrolipoamide acetyltransferase)
MPFTVTMPKLSPTMESGTIQQWLKKVGDKVEAGDVLMEVATDKATVEHSALDEGYLRAIIVPEGQEVAVNAPIAIFTETADESIEGFAPQQDAPKAPVVQEKVPEKAPVAAPKTSERIIASPLAKKLAEQKGMSLEGVQGSGPRGRIVAKDLEKGSLAKASAKPAMPSGAYEEIALTPIKRVTGKRLQEAKSTIPHFYVQQTIDASPLISFREQLSNFGIKVSVNDCIVKACALALREHPNVNAGFHEVNQTLISFKTIDICVAVSIDAGLITPIVTHAAHKSLPEISEEVRSLAKKAKEGKLALHEFQGGSFTISNLGMFGVTSFQAIINPPQAALLAVGGILDVPIVKNGQVVAGKIMNLTLSVDHRVVDGVGAAQFLKTLQKYLENPVILQTKP